MPQGRLALAAGGDDGGGAHQAGRPRDHLEHGDGDGLGLDLVAGGVGGVHRDGVARRHRQALEGAGQVAGVERQLVGVEDYPQRLGEVDAGHRYRLARGHPGVGEGALAQEEGGGGAHVGGADQHVSAAHAGHTAAGQAHGGEQGGVGAGDGISARAYGEAHRWGG
jgi:hypothetical protein